MFSPSIPYLERLISPPALYVSPLSSLLHSWTLRLTCIAFKLRTERLITCSQSCPAWVLSLFGGSNTSHVYETSYVSPSDKRVTMCSTNLTWSNILSVRETVVYQPDTDASSPGHERTKFMQDAKITALCGGWQKMRTKIEEATVERFQENARRGREGFEAVLEMSRRVFGEEKERQRTEMKMA